MEDRVHELEAEINRLEDAIAEYEAALQTFVSAEETQRLTQELGTTRSRIAKTGWRSGSNWARRFRPEDIRLVLPVIVLLLPFISACRLFSQTGAKCQTSHPNRRKRESRRESRNSSVAASRAIIVPAAIPSGWAADLIEMSARSAHAIPGGQLFPRSSGYDQAGGFIALLGLICKNCGYAMFHNLNVLGV